MRIFLLRHAQAASAALSDRDRPLTEQGQKQAQALGADMAQRDMRPGYVLCSPATRTRQTLDALNKAFEAPATAAYPEALYNACPETLLHQVHQVQEADTEAADLLVIAHNPGIHQIVDYLSSGDDGPLLYHPCTLSVLECACDKWKNLMPGKNRLLEIISPRL